MGGVKEVSVTHYTVLTTPVLGGQPVFRCHNCDLVITIKDVARHSSGHGDAYAVFDNLSVLDADLQQKIMEEVNNTPLTYLLLEATDRDDIPAFQCADCDEKLTAVGLAAHLKVHGAKTYKIDTRHLVSPYLVVIGEKFEELRNLINRNYLNSRERSLALMKLDESDLWLTKCQEADSVPYPT